MQVYNKIMLFFWLGFTIVALVFVSYMCIAVGFDRWVFYYTIPVISLMMFLFKRWMMKRMESHQKYLEEKQKNM